MRTHFPSLEDLFEKIQTLIQENQGLTQRLSHLETEFDQLTQEQQLVTEENSKIQEELLREKEKAEESNRLKSCLLSNLSHEFRTPMNGILGFAELLKENLQDKDLATMANNILRSGKRLLSTLNSILFLTELEAGKVKCEPKTIHVNTFILSNIGEFESRASEKNIYIKTLFQDWQLNALADPNLLRIALSNLIENAVKFTEKGGITLETGKMIEEEQTFIYVAVRDSGIGISGENIEKIFETFRQVSEGWSRYSEGTGLGLPICRKIIDVMNGRLLLESHPGEGSSFTLILPCVVQNEEFRPDSPWASIDENMRKPADKKHKDQLPDVLVVEDNSVNKELMGVFLRQTCRTEYACDGETAIEMAANKHYSVILMDINLGPGIDGLQATQEIRKLEGYKQVPIIAVTGYTLSGDKERLIDGGCTHYLAKPFDRSSIVGLVEDVLVEINTN